MGKTRDRFRKIRNTKGTFLAKMGSVKDRNSMDLTETAVQRVSDFIFWAPKSLQMVTATMKLKDTCSLEEML